MEKRALRIPGFLMLLVLLVDIGAVAWVFAKAGTNPDRQAQAVGALVVGIIIFILITSGMLVLSPNEARVIQFFGRYVGSINRAGSTGLCR